MRVLKLIFKSMQKISTKKRYKYLSKQIYFKFFIKSTNIKLVSDDNRNTYYMCLKDKNSQDVYYYNFFKQKIEKTTGLYDEFLSDNIFDCLDIIESIYDKPTALKINEYI